MLLPGAQRTLDASNDPLVKSISNQETFKEENLQTLKKLGEGGQGLAYRVGDFCLKVCRSDYKVGEVMPDKPGNVFTQTAVAVNAN